MTILSGKSILSFADGELLTAYGAISVCTAILIFFVGACLGSALNCFAYRWVRNEKWIGKERSVCPECRHTLGFFDLIPVLSYLFLFGKCRYCGKKIKIRYLVTEVLGGIIFLSLVLRFGVSAEAFCGAVLCVCLMTLSLIDLDTLEIPDRFLVIPAVAAILWTGISGWVTGGLSGCFGNVFHALICGFLPGAFLLIVSLVMDKVLKRDSLGGGDVRLTAMLGLWLDLPASLLMILLACVIGILFALITGKGRGREFAFGPALSMAAWITLIFGDALIHAYLALFI